MRATLREVDEEASAAGASAGVGTGTGTVDALLESDGDDSTGVGAGTGAVAGLFDGLGAHLSQSSTPFSLLWFGTSARTELLDPGTFSEGPVPRASCAGGQGAFEVELVELLDFDSPSSPRKMRCRLAGFAAALTFFSWARSAAATFLWCSHCALNPVGCFHPQALRFC